MKQAALKVASIVVALTMGVSAQANEHKDHKHSSDKGKAKELCQGFVEANDMQIPVGTKRRWKNAAGGLTEQQFNELIDRGERLFAPDVQKAGGTLKVNRKWTDATVNASAQQIGKDWIINMYGGLARHATITAEGFALVICHELGHHIGGAPKMEGWWGDNWATNEGGSDYYATLKCLRRFFAEDDNEAIVNSSSLDQFAKDRCTSQFTDKKDQLLCMRGAMAGESVAGLFQDLRKETKKPAFNTPDPKVVTRTDNAHPATQCRMDTYFAGAVCPVRWEVPNSNTDYKEGSCIQPNDAFGWRPLCWFKP